MTGPTDPFTVANNVASRIYSRLDKGGDLYGRLDDFMSDLSAEVMREPGVDVPIGPDGFDQDASAIFNTFNHGQLNQEIVEHYFRAVREYLESKGAPVTA